jgi:hypothetical protein
MDIKRLFPIGGSSCELLHNRADSRGRRVDAGLIRSEGRHRLAIGEHRRLLPFARRRGRGRPVGRHYDDAPAGGAVGERTHEPDRSEHPDERRPPADLAATAPLAATVIGFYRDAIAATFLVGGAIIALGFLLVLFMPELPLRTDRNT